MSTKQKSGKSARKEKKKAKSQERPAASGPNRDISGDAFINSGRGVANVRATASVPDGDRITASTGGRTDEAGSRGRKNRK